MKSSGEDTVTANKKGIEIKRNSEHGIHDTYNILYLNTITVLSNNACGVVL